MALPTGQILRSFTEQFIHQLPNPALATRGGTLYFLDGISHGKLQNARNSYANYVSTREAPLLLLDTTVLGSGKRGILMTDQSIYYSEIGLKGSQSLDSITKMSITKQKGFKITDLSGVRIFISASLPRSEYHVLRLYLESILSLTFPDSESLSMIEPWRNAPWLEGIIAEIDERMMDELCGTFEAGEVMQEECHGFHFTSHRVLFPKTRWFAFYRDIKGVKVFSYKRHTPVLHVGHSIMLNLVLHAAGAANDHLNRLYSVEFLAKEHKGRSCQVSGFSQYQSSELQAKVHKYGIPLEVE